ncbi:MAG: hypothetical protein J6C98_09805 [Oscillospiraceae bacterium]|nr:hypothetical protein [Oscillospiraceae bacterium]
MIVLEQLKARYARYEQEARKAVLNAKPTDGLFGMGADPRKHPCHDQFYQDVAEWADTFEKTAPSAQAAADAVEWIIRAADSHRDEETYWYMYAAQVHARLLIPLMAPDRCASLVRWYDSAYPPIDRMPVQKELFRLLRKCSKAKK